VTTDPVAALVARALRDLVTYVDRRDESCTEDDDVRALEDVAATLNEVAPQDAERLRSLLGPELTFAAGLSDE